MFYAGRHQKRTFRFKKRFWAAQIRFVNYLTGLERQRWSNSQYSRRDCVEISGIPETIENKDLEGTVLGIFEKLDVMVDPSNVEGCHWIKSSKGAKKVIAKLFRRKDVNKVRLLIKSLKDMSLSSLGINSTV